MKNTYTHRSVRAQSTWKKSHGSIVEAWARRNRRQVVRSRRCGAGRYARPVEDAADRGRADVVAQASQFTPDPLVAPAGVVPCHLLDQPGHRDIDRRAARPARVRP